MKRTSILTAAVLLFASFTGVQNAAAEQPATQTVTAVQSFSDNPPGSQFYTAVEWMAREGISGGYPDGTFGKNRNASRGETVAFLYRYLDPSYTPPTTSFFTDMTPSTLFFRQVSWAAENGVTGGYPDGTFRPRNNVSRGEFATFIYRLEERNFTSSRGQEFRDVASGFYYDPINWMRCYGLSSGYGDATFKPAQAITRGEMAAMLHRYDTMYAQGRLSGPCTQPQYEWTTVVPWDQLTYTQQQAVRMARDYLEILPFSRSGLIDQLEYEGFSTYDATIAVDHLNLNWRQQAVRKAQSYLDFMAFSRTGLIDQLEFDGFSTQDATSAVDSLSVNWLQQAVRKARSYLEIYDFSRSGLIAQLEFDGFTRYQAEYAANQVGL